MTTLPHGRTVLTSDEAAAYAAALARAQVIGSYPITPQTIIVERLADLVAGREDVEFTNLESEHSMFGFVVAASRAGVRTFTATSSQGLLYAHEQLHRASRERAPVVAVNINRAIFAPWSLEADFSDSMSQRDTGWIQLYCASAQEVLDTVLCAYRIAETAMLPVLVNAEGFLLSHTAEIVDVPEQDAVDRFLPGFPRRRTGCSTRTSNGRSRSCPSRRTMRRSSATSPTRSTEPGRRSSRSRGSSRTSSSARRSARSPFPATPTRARRSSPSGRSASRRSNSSTRTTTCCSCACTRSGRSP